MLTDSKTFLAVLLIAVTPAVCLAGAGDLDQSFGSGGMVTTDFASLGDRARALAIQSDGRIVAAGWAGVSGTTDFALARYNPDGSLDATYGIGGLVITDFGSGDNHIRGLAIQSDGRIVAAGATESGLTGENFALARYLVGACPWDCTQPGDGSVGISDFLLLLAQWGGPGTCDIDGGGVGIVDFLALLANWGPCP